MQPIHWKSDDSTVEIIVYPPDKRGRIRVWLSIVTWFIREYQSYEAANYDYASRVMALYAALFGQAPYRDVMYLAEKLPPNTVLGSLFTNWSKGTLEYTFVGVPIIGWERAAQSFDQKFIE